MEMDLIRGLITAVLLLAFIVLIGFTWSRKRKPTYDAAARMPLEDSDRPNDLKEHAQ